ncbi:MAG: gamma-glutamylcyclotransferase [bacterium]|nr:gamma-glutamylcyclotransferase [bacterium]
MIYYFAYGSNMLLARLRDRVPSAEPVGVGKLKEHVFRFHKRSKDGSGKGDIFRTGNLDGFVYGVVFRILGSEKDRLDRAEGLGQGYKEKRVRVVGSGQEWNAFSYYADPDYIDGSLQPYTWYQDFVVAGARENDLPSKYISKIEAVKAVQDPDRKREGENRRILEKKVFVN